MPNDIISKAQCMRARKIQMVIMQSGRMKLATHDT